MKEFRYIKRKNGWDIIDSNGHMCHGLTKDLAYNQWFLKYGINESPQFDMNFEKYMRQDNSLDLGE